MTRNLHTLICIGLGMMANLSGWAQNTSSDKAIIHTYDFGDQSMLVKMSNNGKWAVNNGDKVRIVNLDTQEAVAISSAEKTENARDISDDGTVVVGSKAEKPAVYRKDSGWKTLDTKGLYVYGSASSITPDGKLACGTLSQDTDGYYSTAALWDLETGKLIETPNLPKKDMAHENMGMIDFRGGISPDGQHLLGSMSYSYLPAGGGLGGCFYFVYHRETATYDVIGFTESDTQRWTPKEDNLYFIGDAVFSNDGHYVTGGAYYVEEIAGSEWGNEYEAPFLYDTQSGTYKGYTETESQAAESWAVSNSGIVTLGTPVGTPVREWSVRHGKYWFSLQQILKQKYHQDFASETGLSNTGTVLSISDDGKRLMAFPDPYSSYTIDFPVPIEELCNDLKLLGNFTPDPLEGSSVSHLKTATLTFDRNVDVLVANNAAQILDADGNALFNSTAFEAEGKTVTVKFRKGTMEEGQTYSLYLPAGSIAMTEDHSQTTEAIYITYKGRADEPVKLENALPADGSTFAKIDYSTNPIMLTFDTDIKLTDEAAAVLYRNEEAEPYCDLRLAYFGMQVAVFPSTTQYLFDGSTYRVVVSEGSVTDVGGNNANEEITLHYNGNYERVISADEVVLFSDNFDNGYGNFMMWCGDQNTPTAEMTSWDFSTGMAWGLVRDDEASADRMAASHSMYSPAGKSDDWLVIPQIYIPDGLCTVKFLSQSYLKSKKDYLKVVVWENDNVINTLTESHINQMKAEGKVVYNELQSPGTKEEVLSGDWTANSISLADFAGKNVYIAFVNENENQSAIFMDSLEVRHDMDFLVSFNYDTRVVNQESAEIKGTITNNSQDKTYHSLSATLKDEGGNAIGTWEETTTFKPGDKVNFSFTKPLPLTFGKTNKFTVDVICDSESNEVKGSIDNLAFEPTKRVVLEEYTGRECGNCPLGILAIEKLEARYGDHFLPIAIHTYGSDPLGSGLGNYSSSLGLDSYGAPSGTINRNTPCYPAVSSSSEEVTRFYFSKNDAPAETDALWADIVAEEMETPAAGNISLTLNYDEGQQQINADCDVCYALNADNLNVNLLAVLLEDDVKNIQYNYMSSTSSPDLGEWGLGGKYGESVVIYYCQDVCRTAIGLTINGTSGYVPSSVTAGEHYKANIAIPVPSAVSSVENCKVIVMMIDNNTGRVINAVRAKMEKPDGISNIESNTTHEVLYDLQGRRVSNTSHGIYVQGGKKVIK